MLKEIGLKFEKRAKKVYIHPFEGKKAPLKGFFPPPGGAALDLKKDKSGPLRPSSDFFRLRSAPEA